MPSAKVCLHGKFCIDDVCWSMGACAWPPPRGGIDWHCPDCGTLLQDAGTSLWCPTCQASHSWSEMSDGV